MPNTQLKTAIDVDAVLNELEALVEYLHASAEEAQACGLHLRSTGFTESLQRAVQAQAAIQRLMLNDLQTA